MEWRYTHRHHGGNNCSLVEGVTTSCNSLELAHESPLHEENWSEVELESEEKKESKDKVQENEKKGKEYEGNETKLAKNENEEKALELKWGLRVCEKRNIFTNHLNYPMNFVKLFL